MKKFVINNLKLILGIFILCILLSTFGVTPTHAQTYNSYVWQYLNPQNISGADDLKTKLDVEVNKVITAGHLAPFYTIYGKASPRFDWYHPYDTVYTLSLAYPYVSASTQTAIRTYLQNEMRNYPIWYQNPNVWNFPILPVNVGTGREADNFPPSQKASDFGALAWGYKDYPHLFGLYALWLYAQNTGDWTYINNNWTNITNFYNAYRGEVSRYYTSIAGAIGMARMARQKTASDSAMLTTATNDINAGLTNGKNFTTFGQNIENLFSWQGMGGWVYTRRYFYMGWQFLDISPEIGRYMYDDTALKGLVLGTSSTSDYSLDTALYRYHVWWMGQAPYFNVVYGEDSQTPPILKAMIFPVKSWVQKESATQLRQYVDVPDALIGDYYYMQNLTRTIESSGTECWTDINTNTTACTNGTNPTPTPVPSATPAPCTITSVSWPNGTNSVTEGSNVNISVTASGSCSGKQVHLTARRNISLQPDVDAANQPTPRDVSLIVSGNTATASAIWRADAWANQCLIGTCDPTYFAKGQLINPDGTYSTTEVTTDRAHDLTVTSLGGTTSPTDWPQVQKDPQHTGYSAENFNINYSHPAYDRFKVSWTYAFQPDRVHPMVQAIIYQGKVFVGTEGANGQLPTLYAIDATTGQANSGKVVWKFTADGPILNSAAADNNKVFFATLNGSVYGVDMNGNRVWQKKLNEDGFSTAPIVADNKIMIGGHDGTFYSLNPDDGAVLWSYNTGAPIMMTAAYHKGTDGIGRAIFGGMNMYVYAINTADGTLSWRSKNAQGSDMKIPGVSFKEYWPVITQGKVVIIPQAKRGNAGINPGFPFVDFYQSSPDSSWSWLTTNGPTIAAGNLTQVSDAMAAQDRVMQDYQTNPGKYTDKIIYLLDETTGQETTAAPNWNQQSLSGAQSAPCVDKDGNLVIPINFTFSGWGRLNLNYPGGPRVTDILYDGRDYQEQPFTRASSRSAGFGNADENLTPTCAGNTIFSFHVQEGNANYTGAFDLNNRRWTQINPGFRNQQMSTQLEGRTNPASISNGKIYHISTHELIVREVNP